MDKEQGLTFKNKVCIGIFSGIFFVFICPLLIHDKFGIWGESDTLSYYGTILGATATIIAVTFTIITTRKSAELDRKNALLVNHRNKGIDACNELIEACDTIKLNYLLETLNSQTKKENFDTEIESSLIKIKFHCLIDSIKVKHINFQFLYPKIHKETIDFINGYVINMQLKIEELSKTVNYNGKYFWVDNNILDNISAYQNNIQPAFIVVLQRCVDEYDCETIWEFEFEHDSEKNTEKGTDINKDVQMQCVANPSPGNIQ